MENFSFQILENLVPIDVAVIASLVLLFWRVQKLEKTLTNGVFSEIKQSIQKSREEGQKSDREILGQFVDYIDVAKKIEIRFESIIPSLLARVDSMDNKVKYVENIARTTDGSLRVLEAQFEDCKNENKKKNFKDS